MTDSILDQLDIRTGVLFDGNQFLYRTYHILKSRATGDLTPGFMAYSLLSQLRAAINEMNVLNPVVFVIWDSPTSRNARLGLYPEYKGNRSKSPDLISTTRRMLQIELGNICPRLDLSYADIEADDIIGILAADFNDLLDRWVIGTRDEDLVQCVTENVDYYNPFTKKLWTLAMMEEKYGFSMDRIPLYKALSGDDADNWKGVAGVGPKTVAKWFAQDCSTFELIEDIYNNKIKDAEKKKTFLLGLQICKIPILDDVTPIKEYLIEKMMAKGTNDWSRLHKVFEINDGDKAKFNIGHIQ